MNNKKLEVFTDTWWELMREIYTIPKEKTVNDFIRLCHVEDEKIYTPSIDECLSVGIFTTAPDVSPVSTIPSIERRTAALESAMLER